ncbi:hypothetical protein PYCC9005_004668 [Savitreella phatthalungensis]
MSVNRAFMAILRPLSPHKPNPSNNPVSASGSTPQSYSAPPKSPTKKSSWRPRSPFKYLCTIPDSASMLSETTTGGDAHDAPPPHQTLTKSSVSSTSSRPSTRPLSMSSSPRRRTNGGGSGVWEKLERVYFSSPDEQDVFKQLRSTTDGPVPFDILLEFIDLDMKLSDHLELDPFTFDVWWVRLVEDAVALAAPPQTSHSSITGARGVQLDRRRTHKRPSWHMPGGASAISTIRPVYAALPVASSKPILLRRQYLSRNRPLPDLCEAEDLFERQLRTPIE